MKGFKDDGEKPRTDLLLDFDLALMAIAELLSFGAKKYAAHNWKQVPNGYERYTAALLRHLLKERREVVDIETGLLHEIAVACNALMRLQILLEGLNESNTFTTEDPSDKTS
jgi:hypothetical protein